MWDASVKVPVGVEHGTVYQFGQFDQCMEYSKIISKQQTVRSQYCLANVEMEGLVVRKIATRKERVSIFLILDLTLNRFWNRGDLELLRSLFSDSHEE